MAILLRKPRLEALPRYIGPGPVRLVMREVLAKLVASSFKSGAVLKKLEVSIPRLIEIKNRYLNLFNKISFRFLGAKRPFQTFVPLLSIITFRLESVRDSIIFGAVVFRNPKTPAP